MNSIWAIPVLVSILILGTLGFSQDAIANHIGAHGTPCNALVTVGGGALGLSPGPIAPLASVLGWDVGSGQCNGSFSSVTHPAFTGGALELALRAEQRSVGQVALSGVNDYTVQLGQDTTQPNVDRAWWNFQGSAAYNGVITDLDSLTLTIRTDVGPNLPAAPVFDLLFIEANIAPINDRNNKPNPTVGFSDFFQISQNPEFGWFTVAPDTDGNPSSFDYSVPGAWLFTLTAVEGISTLRVNICIHTPGEICEITFEKVIDICDSDVFTKKHNESQSCIFTINHTIDDSTLTIHDTVPAEWEVLSAVTQDDDDGCVVESANKGKKANKSATHIWCPADEGPITVEIETRESPGKGHTKKGGDEAWKPTFCGVLSLNDGAVLLDGGSNVLDTTNSLSVLVSEGGDSSQDCDGDGLTDLQEYTGSENNDFGNEPTDPANPDSDGDGLSDFDEINIYKSDPNTTTTTILDTTLVGSPGGNDKPFTDDHVSTGTSFGDGVNCPDFSGSVFVLDNGYINVSTTGLLRSTDCTVPAIHDNVLATLHCDGAIQVDYGPTSTVPLGVGATTAGDFDLTDSLGAIGDCSSPTVFVESDGNTLWLAKSP